MAEVHIEVAGRSYEIACRDGEESHLLSLGALVDSKARDAARAMGNMTENRQLLVTALLLADTINEQQRGGIIPGPMPADIDEGVADVMELLADRMEKLATALETVGDSA